MYFEKAIGLQLGMLCFNRIIELVQVTDFKNCLFLLVLKICED